MRWRDSIFQHFVWVRSAADADCVISTAYSPEKVRKISKKWDVLARRNKTIYPPGQKCFPTNRDFRSGRVIRLLAIQGEFTSTFSPVARQLLVFRTYDIYEKFF